MKNKDVIEKDNLEEQDSLQGVSMSTGSAEESNLSRDFLPKKEPDHILLLNSNRSNKQLFFPKIYGLDNKIPKHIISFDEKYLLRCLQWMYMSAFGAASCNFSSKLGIVPNGSSARVIRSRSGYDMAGLVIECPIASVMDRVAINSVGDCILGTITSSKSMINILRSPLLHQLGALDSNVGVGERVVLDVKEAIASDFLSSPGKFSTSQPKKLKDMVLGDQEYESEPVHKRLASASSTNSTCSDQSSSSDSAAIFQGMLQCTWKDGYPNYLFSVDDHGEVYAANILNIQSPDDKVLDYIYSFHLKSGRKGEHEIRDKDLDLVARMKVTTSITLCPKNSEIVETQFVLFGSSDSWTKETQNSVHAPKKNKGLTKKVVDVFKTSKSRKQRTSSMFWGTSIILEDTSWESSYDVCDNLDYSPANLMENDIPPNLELAAIVVKDHICRKPKEQGIGGWGLKFLKKSGNNQTDTPSETSVVSECCQRDGGECSTSMNILVPAGFHGGPRDRKGGPSSLVERWHSGGQCDCGGWDVGCPLTVINTKTNRMESLPGKDYSGECKAVDLFVKGSQQSVPIMKMTNIHEDLHYIHFQSTLSAIQCFSIAVAIIHSNSPALRPKLYRKVETARFRDKDSSIC
ncbi:hypothetical protein ACH5RR_031592 [Cinchona calisaya]|uniref:Uncharacterized protein n=1 Tax=Cinchona calisaya TaxID=153742 RepID=A0ABD2YFP3_9GENT